MTLVVRTPDNDNAGNATMPIFGWFDITLPMGYATGHGVSVAVTVGLVGSSSGFSGANANLLVSAVTLAGGAITNALLATDNLSWRASQDEVVYYAGPQQVITASPATLTFSVPGTNIGRAVSGGTTLEPVSNMRGSPFFIGSGSDNTGYFIVGDGMGGFSAGAAEYVVIKGDGYPSTLESQALSGSDIDPADTPWNIGIANGSRQFAAGDTVSVLLYADCVSGDSSMIAAQISSVTWNAGLGANTLDLTTIRRGFGPGDPSYYADGPIGFSGGRTLHSFYKTNYVPPVTQRVQGHVFG
jgi:hypothetical protein